MRGRRAVEGDEEVGPGAEEEGEVLWKPEISDGVAVLLYASAQRKRERRCGRRRWKTKGCCGCEGVAVRVWQGVLHEMGCRRTCCCNWEKERWRERGKGEEERRQRVRKAGERDRERELRCVRWRVPDLEWVGVLLR